MKDNSLTANELRRLFPRASESVIKANCHSHSGLRAVQSEYKFARTCLQCGTAYEDYAGRRPKFCSLKCAHSNRERIEAVASKLRKDRGFGECPKCNKIFKKKTNGATIYCSSECASSHIGSVTILKNRAVRRVQAIRTASCPVCNKQFNSWKSDNRIYCSIECSSKSAPYKSAKTKHRSGWFRNAKPYSRGKQSWVEIDGKRFFARSSWEGNYGRYLGFLKRKGQILDFDHEKDVFWFNGIKRGVLSYLPDFKVTTNEGKIEYHEVKGWMDKKSKTKIKRMKKYHPAVVLKVVDSVWFKKNNPILKNIIEGWNQ